MMKLKDLRDILKHPLRGYTLVVTLRNIVTGDNICDLCTIECAMENFGECFVANIHPKNNALIINLMIN